LHEGVVKVIVCASQLLIVVLMLGAMVILTVATRRSEQPFAQERQKLRG